MYKVGIILCYCLDNADFEYYKLLYLAKDVPETIKLICKTLSHRNQQKIETIELKKKKTVDIRQVFKTETLT